MSHGDTVFSVPEGYGVLAHIENSHVAAFRHKIKPIYGLQWHPEVVHTEKGMHLLRNFLFEVCQGKAYWETKLSRRLSTQELAYTVLMEYFSLGLDHSDFIRCWSVARNVYGQKMQEIREILDAALERHNLFNGRTDLKRVFSDLLYVGKSQRDVVVGISRGFYKGGVIKRGE